MMDSDLGLSFSNLKISPEGGLRFNFFFKKLYFDLPIPKRGLPGPIVYRFGVMELQSFAKFGLIRHIVSGRQFFAR